MAGKMGRPVIFAPKEYAYHGNVTKAGRDGFEAARLELAALVGWEPKRVSHGDVIDYLAIGKRAAAKLLRLNKRNGRRS